MLETKPAFRYVVPEKNEQTAGTSCMYRTKHARRALEELMREEQVGTGEFLRRAKISADAFYNIKKEKSRSTQVGTLTQIARAFGRELKTNELGEVFFVRREDIQKDNQRGQVAPPGNMTDIQLEIIELIGRLKLEDQVYWLQVLRRISTTE